MTHPPLPATKPTPIQRWVISLIAGLSTVLLISLLVGVLTGMESIGTPRTGPASLLRDVVSTALLSLVVTWPFGLILAPVVSFVFSRMVWPLRLIAYVLIPTGVAQWLLLYNPQGDGIPFFAFAALGGGLYFVLERGVELLLRPFWYAEHTP